MAFIHGRDAVFKLDDNGGTLRTASAYVDNIDFPMNMETHETTVYGKKSKTYVVGLKDSTFSIGGPWDGATSDVNLGSITFDAFMNGLLYSANFATSKSFEIHPEGTASGKVKYSGECFPTSYSGAIPVGDAVKYTADFQVTDDVTRGTN